MSDQALWKNRWTSSMCFWSIASCLIVTNGINAQQDVVLTMTSGEQCFGSRVTLLCTHPDPLADPVKFFPQLIAWTENGTTIDFSDPSNARFTPTRVNSTSSTLSFTVTEEDHRDRVITFTCFLVFNNASRDESNVVMFNALETTTPPTITSLTTSTSDVLRWTRTPNMCSDYTYKYVLTWSRTDPANNPTNGDDTAITQGYDFSGLPREKYTVTITAQRVDYPFVRSEPVSMSISLTAPSIRPKSPTDTTDTTVGGLGKDTMIIIIVVVVVVILLITGTIIVIITICVRRNKPKVTQTNDNVQEQQVQYTEVYISNNRPRRAPLIPDVEYAEALEPGRKVRSPSPDPLPPKKGVKRYIKPDPFKSNELRMEVVAILQQKKIVHGSLDPDEAVVGTYQNKTFVANFVCYDDNRWDVPEREIDEMVKTRDHQGTDLGLLVANMETLPSNLLEKLEKQHCHFIGVGRIEQLNENALMKKFDLCF